MSAPPRLLPGLRLHSQVCDTEVIVIRPGATPVDLRCGGVPMTPDDTAPAEKAGPDPAHAAGTLLGKRYTTAPGASLEILVTKPGAGSLSDGDVPLVLKAARQLPASD
jgi:hypothetical protein